MAGAVTKIWLGEQERSYSCGAASLKYALCLLGFSPREADLRRLAKTSWRGTQTKHLVRAAQRLGVNAKVRHFLEDEWQPARAWLFDELRAGHAVILDVDGFEHYVTAADVVDDRVAVLDPEGGPMDGSAYARLVLCGDARLRRWWLSGDEQGEPDAFRAIALWGGARGPRLRFSAAAIRRYNGGRPWILDEYLIDVVEMAKAAAASPGDLRPLAELVREAAWLPKRTVHWADGRAPDVMMAKAHLEDIALAAAAMQLVVPAGASAQIAADVAAILTTMLHAPD